MTNDVNAIEAAMKLAALDWNIYGRALEEIKEGRVSAEDPEELRRYLEFFLGHAEKARRDEIATYPRLA